MSFVEAEMTSREIANKVGDAINGLPIDAPPTARIAMNEARAALLRALRYSLTPPKIRAAADPISAMLLHPSAFRDGGFIGG